jgi:hypothetical protein
MREALKWGIDAACGWILGEWERGRAINRPSPISEIRPDETEQAESFVRLVTLDMDAYAIKYSK